MPHLLLAEHKYQVHDFMKRGLNDQGHWIALGPSAMASLDKLNIPYKIPEDFFNSKEHETICHESHEQFEKLCQHFDDFIYKTYPELRELGIKPFLFHYPTLTMRVDILRSRIFQLSHIIRAYPNYEIYIHNFKNNQKVIHWNFSNNETVWGYIASLKGWPTRIHIMKDTLTNNHREALDFPFRSFFKDKITESVTLFSAARLLSSGNLKNIGDLLPIKRGKTLIVVGAVYEWQYVLPLLRKKGWKILFADNTMGTDRSNVSLETTNKQYDIEDILKGYKLFFYQNNISFLELIEKNISWIFNEYPNQIKIMKEKIKRIKKKYNICGVMRSSAPNAMAHTVNQLARNLKIPVFTWQHGHVGFNKIIDQFGDYFNLMTSDYTFVFGKGSQKAHETSSQSFPSKIHITGSASIDSLKGSIKTNRSNKPSSKTRVLYATTNYYQNHWYFGMLPGLSDRHLYLDQKTIYQALLRLQKRFNLELTIKLYPSDEFLEPPWARDANFCGPQVKFVKGEKSFTELLLCHDIVILDSPSTTLLQALSTTLPVFILMRYWRYPPPMMRSLSRRIVCKEDAEELISDLEKLLIDQNYPVDLLNVDFLKEFGTHTDDGQSAQRTMHYMNTILNES